MKSVVKALLYVACILLAVMSLQRVRIESARPSARARQMALADDSRDREAGTADAATAATAETNAPTTAEVAAATNASAGTVTNVVATATNATAAVERANPPGGSSKPTAARAGDPSAKTDSALGFWMASFVVGLLGLAGLGGWDVTQWFAARANRALGVEVQAPEAKSPEYDAAEQEWAKGNHLDAITMMREYLAENPNEQYVALRIAEIYEKDLGNYLAAALEFEEVLNKKLPREKWGWTALRLSNLYSGRLNQPDKAIGTLQRVIRDYPDTAAAKKARERLGIPEPTEEPVGEMDVDPVAPTVAAKPTESAESSALPSGFRRKK